MRYFIYFLLAISVFACKKQLPETEPTVITQKLSHDSDDPAIWINKIEPSKSIIFGTDKDEVNGGVYAFDLDGNILKDKSITKLSYPNNVDVEYGFVLNDSTTTDILVFSEREKYQIRVFSIPDMLPLDNGGFKVFADEIDIEMKRPMGVSLYKNPDNGSIRVCIRFFRCNY